MLSEPDSSTGMCELVCFRFLYKSGHKGCGLVALHHLRFSGCLCTLLMLILIPLIEEKGLIYLCLKVF